MEDPIDEAKDKAEQLKLKLAEAKGRAKQKVDDLRHDHDHNSLSDSIQAMLPSLERD